MASITGKAGAVTIATVAVSGKVEEWKVEIEADAVEDTAAGDIWKSQVYLTSQWVATFTAIMPDAAGWDWYGALVGTDVAIALKRKAADTGLVFSDTGLLKSVELTHPADDVTRYTVVVEGNDGATGPTIDTTPAS